MSSFVSQLKQRRVYRVAIGYAIVAWLAVQIAATVLPAFHAPEFIGRGLGGALLTHAIEQAWTSGAKRVWVHTCELDHPAALTNYEARGMRTYKTGTMAMPRGVGRAAVPKLVASRAASDGKIRDTKRRRRSQI